MILLLFIESIYAYAEEAVITAKSCRNEDLLPSEPGDF